MLIMTRQGLYCPAGNFYIDPKGKVEHAVVTHAHSDHARRGAQQYYCVTRGVSLLKVRLGKSIKVSTYEYGESFFLNGVKLSFHPAGHILGSSQVRIEYEGEVWVASGDYKRQPDPTCEPFEVVKCDVFITEATFGTPAYDWPQEVDLGRQIHEWWDENRRLGFNSVLFAYSLGKAQHVLSLLEPFATRAVHCHPAATHLNDCYRELGVKLAKTQCLSQISPQASLSGELLLVPQSFLSSPQANILGGSFKTAFASGWMANNSFNYKGSYDKGFTLSDHADWKDLVRTIIETGAKRVYVQHRGRGALVRHLKSLGIKAYSDEELFLKQPDQLSLF